MLSKFDKLISLLLEDPDYSLHKKYDDEDAVTFGIILDTLFYKKYPENYHEGGTTYTHSDLLANLNRLLIKHKHSSATQVKLPVDLQKLTARPYSWNIIGKLKYTLNDIDTKISQIGSARNILDSPGRFWIGDSVSIPFLSFWVKKEQISRKNWNLIWKMLNEHNINKVDCQFQFIDMLDDDLLTYDEVFKWSARMKTKSKVSDKKIAEIKAKGHLIGGKWGAALRNL